MKFSMMSYTMARQPKHFNVLEMLELTRELDMAGIDFVKMHHDPWQDDKLHGIKIRELRKMTDDHGIPAVCYTFHAPGLGQETPDARRQGVEDVRHGIDVAVRLGAPIIMIITPGTPKWDLDTARNYWTEGLRQSLPIAENAGVTLTVENFPGEYSCFVTADDFLQAADKAPGLKLTYDCGNAASGEDPINSFVRCANYAVHAHFKDWYISDTPAEGHNRMRDGRYYKPALIGEGAVNHAGCLAAMKNAGYAGCINIEYEGDTYPPDEAVRRAVEYLRKLL